MATPSNVDIAARFFDAVVRGDRQAMDELLAPDATLWQNFSGRKHRREQALALFAGLAQVAASARLDDVRRAGTATGFVEQHTLVVTTRAGTQMAGPGCFIATVRDGRITQMEEYIDSAHLAPLMAGGAS